MLSARVLVVAVLLATTAVALGRVDVVWRRGFQKRRLSSPSVRNSLKTTEDEARAVPFEVPFEVRVNPGDSQHTNYDTDNDIDNEPEPNPSKLQPQKAGRATPCQTTSQWEGRASEWDHVLGINNRFNITFDGVNRRKRIMEDKHAQLPGKRIYEYIQLYNQGIQYVINHNYNTCRSEAIGTWRNHTIPAGSTLEDRYEIGVPGNGFMVQEWSDRIPGRQKESWIGTYTDSGCWPVTEIYMEKDEHNVMVQSVSTRFFDLTSGIKDVSVFTPPSFCPQPQLTTPPQSQPTTPTSRLMVKLLKLRSDLARLMFL